MGQIDPRIPLSAVTGGASHGGNLAGMLSDVLQVQEQMATSQERGRQREDAARTRQAEARLRELVAQDPYAIDDHLVEISKLDPEYALTMARTVGQTRYAQAQQADQQLKTEAAALENAGRLAQGVTDQASWNGLRQYVLERDPRLEPLVPLEYTPEAAQRVLAVSQSTAEFNKAKADGIKRVLDGDWQAGIGWALSKAPNAAAYQTVLDEARGMGAPASALALFDPQYSPQALERAAAAAISPKDAQTMAATAADRTTDNARQAQTAAEQARHNRVMEARPVGGGSGTVGGVEVSAERIADAIIAGQQPPTLQGLYRYGAAVRTVLAKKGYDFATASADWAAASKHFATINGAQQTRIRQAVITAHDSLDVIDDLATRWKGGGFPILNRANLALAKGGAFGKDAASIATQLDGQITDVTSELANVYMGGNSPTDHALKLAEKNLRADWDMRVLLDMTALARKNLEIRSNSIAQAAALGPSADNPYDGQTPAAPASARPVVAPNGTTYTFPTQKAADDFKRAAGIK